MQPIAALKIHLRADIGITRRIHRHLAEVDLRHLIAQLTQTINHTCTHRPSVNERRVWMMLIDTVNHTACNLHCGEPRKCTHLFEPKTLTNAEHSTVIAKPRYVDAEDHRLPEHIIILEQSVRRLRDKINRNHHIRSGCRKITEKLLANLHLCHLRLHILQFFGGKHARFISPINARVPAIAFFSVLVHLVKLILSLRRSNEHRPPFTVGKRRTDNTAPELRLDVRVLIENNPVEVDAAQRVGMVRADDIEPCARRAATPRRKLDIKLRLIHCAARDWIRVVF